jgi:hypothetical protein
VRRPSSPFFLLFSFFLASHSVSCMNTSIGERPRRQKEVHLACRTNNRPRRRPAAIAILPPHVNNSAAYLHDHTYSA